MMGKMQIRGNILNSGIIDTAKVLSSIFDVVFKINNNGQLELFSSEQSIFSKITSIENIANETDTARIYKLIDKTKAKKNVKTFRIRLLESDFNIDWVDIYIARDDKNNAVFLTLKDITEGQRNIERLSEAGIFDSLTGAYYRSVLPELLSKTDLPGNLPIAIFMFDVNGMKIINDIFGYDEGNKLLVKCATIISLAAPSRGMIVRMSGDEFLLMVPKCLRQERQYIADKIIEYTKEERNELITPDISMGIGVKEITSQSLETILRRTEEKLIEKRKRDSASFKNTIVRDLLRHLSIKNFETTKHIIRVKGLSLMLGESLKFDQEDMNILALAADIHDIGKVLIPEEILSKKGNLTKKEWKEIKLHPITSYYIANALLKYKSTANVILYHHENWDGSGYPEGIKEDKIPLMSRILSIVDSFDMMQNTTHYRKKFYSPKGALMEIKKGAGTKFDPNLVRLFLKIMTP